MAADVNNLTRRYMALRSERSGWDSAWESLAELFLPTRWRSDTDVTAHQKPRLNGRLVNSCGVLAMRTLAAGMQGGMTSPVRPWFRITVKGGDQEGAPDGLNAWLEEVTRRMQAVLHQSNFYNAVHGLYSDLGCFGTGLLVETADEEGVHFELVRAGEYVLDVDSHGQVNCFFRRIYMTARQIVERWGEKAPTVVRNAATPRKAVGGTVRFDVIHAVYPRTDVNPNAKLSAKDKPYASVYFLLQGGESGKAALLSEGGYDMFPAFAPRWDAHGSDVYGRSPAMDVTPDCKMLQAMTTTMRRLQHKMADPPYLIDASMRSFGVDLNPGGRNFVNMSGVVGGSSQAAVQSVEMPAPASLQYTMEGIREVEQVVRDGLYTDLFRMLVDDDRRQVTATEIQAKQQEKMILIGPVVERLHKELLEPLILRTYQLMGEWGALPEAPEGVEPLELDVSFESVLAQAQRASATSSMDQGVAFLLNCAQGSPDILDNIDTDELARAYMDRIGMPASCVRDGQGVDEIRQQRAAQQAQVEQQAMMAQAAQQGVAVTQAAKNLGQTPTGADGQTLMGTLLGGLTGGA